MKLHIRIFLDTALIYFTMIFLFEIFTGEEILLLLPNLILRSLIFGAAMSLVLGLLHKFKVEKMNVESEAEKLRVKQNRKIKFNASFEKVFTLCTQAIETNKRFKLIEKNKEDAIVRATTGLSLDSFGDEIKIEVKKLAKESTEVNLYSKPKLRFTIVDYGRNIENLNIITAHITKKMKENNV